MVDEAKYYLVELESIADLRCPSHSGILVNTCLGKKWVYIKDVPEFAVTYSNCVGGCGIFGKVSSNETIRDFLFGVFEDLKKKEIYDFEFSCENPELSEQVLSLFPEKTVNSEMEYSYRYIAQSTFDVETLITNGYEICPIDKKLLEHIASYENRNMVLERMQNSWEEESFLKHSVGFVAIKDNQIIGIIFGSGKYQKYVAIDIEVDEAHRRQNIAENLTKYFITECQKRNYVAQWDCVESNIASQKVAEKVGFEILKKRPYYWFDI